MQNEHNPQQLKQNIRLPGQYHDPETGLYYNRHRYYDPALGSYINQDPIGLDSGEPNFYAYPRNPLQLQDPYGLLPSLPRGNDDNFGGFFWNRILDGGVKDNIFSALKAELGIVAGGTQLILTCATGGAAGAFIGLHGVGNIAGGVGDYLNIFDSGTRDYNLTRQGYENIFQAAGQNPENGARAFYLTDAAVGVGALLSPVVVNVVGPATITGKTTVPAYKTANPAIITHDAVQIG